MFDKKLLMSHIENETNNDKMMRAGVSTPFYGNVEEKYGKKITKSHGKNYPKGTHMCATHVEHAEWGQGTPVHGEHAAPDENGQISWYNVMFEHGVETVNTSDMKVLAEASHENHDHHDHPGEDLSEVSLSTVQDAARSAEMQLKDKDLSPERRKKLERQKKLFDLRAAQMGSHLADSKMKHTVEEQAKLNIILKTLTGREGEPGEKTPGRGEDPTDHHEVDGQPRQRGRLAQLARDVEASQFKRAKRVARMVDPDIKGSEVRAAIMGRIADRMREAGDL